MIVTMTEASNERSISCWAIMNRQISEAEATSFACEGIKFWNGKIFESKFKNLKLCQLRKLRKHKLSHLSSIK